MRTMNKNGTINGLNSNQTRRDEIIHSEANTKDGLGGIFRFDGLTLAGLDELLRNNFIAWDEQQNSGPTVEEIHQLMKDFPGFTAHGYAVERTRSDYRVSLEGVEWKGPAGKVVMAEFVKLCRNADDFICEQDHLFAWWN